MGVENARKHASVQRAALKAVGLGRWPLREVVQDGSRMLKNVAIYRVLLAAPGLGPEKMRSTLERANVWPFVPLGQLSSLERQAILDHLPKGVK